MQKKGCVFVFLVFILALQGCETIKGASEGFKKDWKDLQKVDSKLEKDLW